MKTLLIIVVSALMISVFGCQKEDASKNNTGTGLIGKWEWVSTTGGLAGIHQTPQTLGYTYWIGFTADSLYQVYDRNNHLTSSNHFTVFYGGSIFYPWSSHFYQMIRADNLIRSSFEIRKDSLFLSQEVMDGFNQVFIRK